MLKTSLMLSRMNHPHVSIANWVCLVQAPCFLYECHVVPGDRIRKAPFDSICGRSEFKTTISQMFDKVCH